MTREQKAARGRKISTVVEDLTPIFEALEASYIEQSVESGVEDQDLREHVYHRVRVLRDFRRSLEMIIADGAIAEAEVLNMAKLQNGGGQRSFF